MLWLLLGCIGINPNRIPNQELYADQGESRQIRGQVGFAVVGDSRPALPLEGMKRNVTPATQASIAGDISSFIQDEYVKFVVLLGDVVQTSSTTTWRMFTRNWQQVLSGTEPPVEGAMRVRAVPVAGNHEALFDARLKGFGAAFQGVGADIGYNRVGSWYFFDVDVNGHVWRFLVLDSNRETMGSRWTEQVKWLEKDGLEGNFDSILVFMHHPLLTLGSGHGGNDGGAPKELLSIVEDQAPIGSLKVVFSSHNHTNEVFMPSGKLGELYVNAGGGGAPADSLARWGDANVPGYDEIRLEPIYDLSLLKEFGRWAEARSIPEAIVEKGRGEGAYEGFIPVLDGKYFPIQGWWNVTLDGDDITLTFRMIGADGAAKDLYSATRDGKEGWKIGR